jgi:AraC family transcriptional regulator of adaptative response / DNA-3-methyladenine glycosylase II
MLEPDTCFRALQFHDRRFDGRFFVAVQTTRIYCRPVCRVRLPKRENCRFYPTAAAAEAAGYRPCLRCRPELAPGNASIDAADRLAKAAASLIEDGVLENGTLEIVAGRLGVTTRHLRRVFQEEFGVTPVHYAQTQRLLLAKRLLTDTTLPVTDVAFAAGFGSLRRFNSLFQSRYRLQPTQLRRTSAVSTCPDTLLFHLRFKPPYDWNGLAGFLSARAIHGVESLDDDCYRRTVRIGKHAGWIEVRPNQVVGSVQVALPVSLAGALPGCLARIKHLFDLGCDPAGVAAALGPLAARNPGLRVPGAFDGFEIAVRAILGQQVSVAAARTLAGRLATAFGRPVSTPFPNVTIAFPEAGDLAASGIAPLTELGILPARATTLIELAKSVHSGALVLAPGAPVDTTIAGLKEIRGIGEWTAQYIAMRALAWPDAFPHTDLGLVKALGERRPKAVLAMAEQWRPWRSYAALHLWTGGGLQNGSVLRAL